MLIHKIIEEQVNKTPNKPAIVFDNLLISYLELNKKANQLAHFLQRKGVKPETLIAISMNRSIDMIITILGILKAGGAYVPIEPALPNDRIRFILEDTNHPLLLTVRSLQAQYSSFHNNIITLDEIWADSLETDNPVSSVKDCNLAYVIYTSGSSGKPKGVLIEHKGIANLAIAQAEIFKIDSESKVLQFSSICFDASVSEWATTLSHGATLCIPNIGTLSVADALSRLLKKHKYTVATIPPSVLSTLPDNLITPLKTLIVAGEPCNDEIIKKWKNKVYLINAYGPTEYTVCITTYVYDGNFQQNTIGKPLTYTKTYILDDNLKPVANGDEGELYVEGIGVARGYLNRPDLTQSKFLPNPIGNNGELIYKTGDKVRLLPDGNLQFLGRLDDQVKINGYRIETSEIEKTITELFWIKDAVVLTRVRPSGNKQLVAFFISYDSENISLSPDKTDIFELIRHKEAMILKIKQHLAAFLPVYMIPNFIIPVDEFPLTIQGKIDKNSLFKLCKQKINGGKFTPNQLAIAKIWREVLEVNIPSPTASFFDMGGNSLLLYKLLERLQHYFKTKFEVTDFFLHPNIEAFSKFVLKKKQTIDSRENESINRTFEISKSGRILAIRNRRLKI